MTQRTVEQTLTWAKNSLANISETPLLDAEVLLGSVLDKTRTYLKTWPDALLTDEQQEQFALLLVKRMQGYPIAYILGYKEFWDMKLKVTEHTLIPRPETELLVEIALQLIPSQKSWVIADLGTGTGAIALAIARERPKCQIMAVDKSSQALEIAQHNAKSLAVSNVHCVLSDWCEALDDRGLDLIVSNPPYIDINDPHLQQGDVRFEPNSALVSGANGLHDIQQIAFQACRKLKKNGWLMFEHGYNQRKGVQGILEQLGYQEINSMADLASQDRITWARWPA